MKKLIVKMEFELEVPDDVEIREVKPDMGDFLFVQDQYLEPTLSWMVLDEISEDGTWSLSSSDDDLFELLQSYLKIASVNMDIFEMQ